MGRKGSKKVIVTKKRYEREVRRRAKVLAQRELERRLIMKQKKQIRTLEQKLMDLERKVDKLRSAGKIKGYYQADDGKVIICESEEKDHDR